MRKYLLFFISSLLSAVILSGCNNTDTKTDTYTPDGTDEHESHEEQEAKEDQ
ncbi:hypothetical protein [Domibacillus indicus]|uniref:hypothetical protein n=1 Tax=Domibacillus indicus TaxID=1437523 RepID=UPI0012E072B8|nr:hypothetical protein [Domibacillus indicus]